MKPFSPTTLNLFLECPRCFWLHLRADLKRPRGVFPSLPGGMDRVLKAYFDDWRRQGTLPPEVAGAIRGHLMPDQTLLDTWRDWRRGLMYRCASSGATLVGALDDCVVDEGRYVPLDYKTRGTAPTTSEYYQFQLDAYGLLLEVNGFPAGAQAYLVYYYPGAVEEKGRVRFNITVTTLAIQPARAREAVAAAAAALAGPLPERTAGCDYCQYEDRSTAVARLRANTADPPTLIAGR